jgi:hypothetical protein
MKYCVKDMVKFYPNVTTNQIFIGEVVDVYMGMNQYKIVYEGSKYCVHEQFIISKASHDEIKIMQLELKVSEKDLMIKELTDKVDKFAAQLEAQVDVAMDDMKKIDNLCKDKSVMEVLLADCKKTLEKAHREIVDLKYKIRKLESEKWKKRDFDYFPKPRPYTNPIKKKYPWGVNGESISKSGVVSKSCGCCVKSS